jgi:hypothetical protein
VSKVKGFVNDGMADVATLAGATAVAALPFPPVISGMESRTGASNTDAFSACPP